MHIVGWLAVLSCSTAAEERFNYNSSIIEAFNTNRPVRANTGDLSSIFARRWPRAIDNFAPGLNGRDRPSNGQEASDSGYSDLAVSPGNSATSGSDSQYGGDGPGVRRSGVWDCGPSSASGDEIKVLVDKAAAMHGVDTIFAEAIAWSETHFDRSRDFFKGARGPMQAVAATATGDLGVMDLCDPLENIDHEIGRLRVLLDEFKNPLLAAAAYNAGAEPVYRYGGVPPYPETVSFVARVVNFTLGLQTFADRARGSSQQIDVTDDTHAGVITRKKPGAFVGGVMQFSRRDE